VLLGRNRARPICTVRRWQPNSAGPRNARARGGIARRRVARRRHCSACRRRLGTGARETAGKRWLTGAEMAAWRDGDGRVTRDGVGLGVGGFGPRRLGRRRECGERSGGGRRRRGDGRGRAARGGCRARRGRGEAAVGMRGALFRQWL
jgi:hypothetical protein